MTDIIQIDVPTFIRLLELSREDVTNDADLHHISTIVTKLSQDDVVTMDDYEKILSYCKECKNDDMADLKRLSGIK